MTSSRRFDSDLNAFVQLQLQAVWPEMEMHGLKQLIMKYRGFHFSCFEAAANQLLDLLFLWGCEMNLVASSWL